MKALTLTSEQKRATAYTGLICLLMLLGFVFYSWSDLPPSLAPVMEQMEIDLGNNVEGFGDEQPLAQGESAPLPEEESGGAPPSSEEGGLNAETDETPEPEAAPLPPKATAPKKTGHTTPAPTPATTTTTPSPAPPKPKATFPGTGGAGTGNQATTDNGFTSQGNRPGSPGDRGQSGGTPRKVSVNRAMLGDYQFQDELGNEKIYAEIEVSPGGQPRFIRLVKPSTSFDGKYRNAVINCLPRIRFEGEEKPYKTTLLFDFRVN